VVNVRIYHYNTHVDVTDIEGCGATFEEAMASMGDGFRFTPQEDRRRKLGEETQIRKEWTALWLNQKHDEDGKVNVSSTT
jgi:1,4-alpha-glucan branching enzyme